MFIHIGGESTVSDKYIVGIFDMEWMTVDSEETIDFIRQAEEAGHVEVVSSEIPRSFVVTLDRVYLTPISVATLRRRIERALDRVV